jgi:hypothetical protein
MESGAALTHAPGLALDGAGGGRGSLGRAAEADADGQYHAFLAFCVGAGEGAHVDGYWSGLERLGLDRAAADLCSVNRR